MSNISRREAIRKVAIMLGGTIALPDILKAWESPEIINVSEAFKTEQGYLIGQIAEAIIPTTDTPGAIAAGVPAFIEKMIADCYTKEIRDKFYADLDRFGSATNYLSLSAEKRIEALKQLEADALKDRSLVKRIEGSTQLQPAPLFDQLKSLTITGYFTSEIGCTQALRYEQVPGRYDGDVPYKKGDRAWAN
jgi:hypothetical protein